MIKLNKRYPRKAIGRKSLTYDELLALVIDAKSFLNSCPLIYVSSKEVEKLLTPSHQLTGCHIISLPDPVASDDDDDELESTEGLTHRITYFMKSRRLGSNA